MTSQLAVIIGVSAIIGDAQILNEETAPPPALGRSPIAQLCFVTDNLESSVAEFAKVTGLTPGAFGVAANADTPTIYNGQARTVHARTCAFRLPNIDVEFLEPGPEPSAWRDTLNARGRALHHIAFRCSSLATATNSIAGQSQEPCQSADFVDGGGAYAVFDTSLTIGAMIELFELRTPGA